jgi:indole-3-glycerol phosphate synthase
MTILEKIVEKKKYRLSSAKYNTPLSELKSIIQDVKPPRDFSSAITKGTEEIRLIAEIKKASPSKGLIRKDFDHRAIARIYGEKNVDAISVITEDDFFQGRLEFLAEVKEAVTRPVLRKDFLFDEYQIYEARAHDADAVLLIAALLDTRQAEDLMGLTNKLGMSVLFEVHNREELEKALTIDAPIIGVNNRDLKTLSIDLTTSLALKKEIPEGKVVVSESGIGKREDVLKVASAGIDAILVGTCIMESPDIGAKIDELVRRA